MNAILSSLKPCFLSVFRAASGTCWCSEEVWTGAEQQSEDGEFERLGLVGQSLGTFQLKGVPDMDLVQCRCVGVGGESGVFVVILVGPYLTIGRWVIGGWLG